MKTTFTKKFFLLLVFTFSVAMAFAQFPSCHWVTKNVSQGISIVASTAIGSQGQVYDFSINQGTAKFSSFYDTTTFSNHGGIDMVISKHDPAGNYVWVKRLTSVADVYEGRILLDNQDNIYILAQFRMGTIDFDPSPTSDYPLTSVSTQDICLAKYTSEGDFIWAKQFGITGDNWGRNINLTSTGTLLISGEFSGTINFGTAILPINLTSNGQLDIYVAEFDLNGQALDAKNLGGNLDDYITSQSLDEAGNIYYYGASSSSSIDINLGISVFNLTNTSSSASFPIFKDFLLKYTSSNQFVWVKQFETETFSSNWGNNAKATPAGEVYVTGQLNQFSTLDLDPSPTETFIISGSDYLVKLNSAGDFMWAKTWQTNVYGFGSSYVKIEFDTLGNIYQSGIFVDTVDFDPGVGVEVQNGSAYIQPYLLSLTQNGDFRYVHTFINIGDSVASTGQFIAAIYTFKVEPDGETLYLGGGFVDSLDFKPGNSDYLIKGDPWAGYLAKYSFCPILVNEDIASFCDSISYQWEGNSYTEAGTYFTFFETPEMCDSIRILHLQQSFPTQNLVFEQSCAPIIYNNETFAESGIYNQSLINSKGCDSVLTINFERLSSTTAALNLETCESTSINGIIYNQSGTFNQVLTNNLGCDSTLTINLDILNLNAQIFQTDSLLFVNGNPTAVQWINCATGQAIAGATQTSFVPQISGNYGAVITVGECVDTSNCRQIIISNTPKKTVNLCESIVISPNPTTSKIEFSFDKSSYTIQLFTATGALLYRGTGFAGTQQLDLSSLANAMYVLQVDECRFKVVKQ